MNTLLSTIPSMVLIPGQPALSMVLIVVLLMVGLYMGRSSIHKAIQRIMDMMQELFEGGAQSFKHAEEKLSRRNREVLLELGKNQVEREIEREFFRINAVAERDLGKYPELHRVIADQVTQIEEDYKKSGQMVPPPPEWVEAVDAVANLNLDKKNQGLTAKILKSIHDASLKHQKEAIQEYRQTVTERHQLLQNMRPYWRRLSNTIEEVGSTIKALIDRSSEIDNHMTRYEEIRRGSEKAESTLRASSTTQFAISLFVVLVAAAGAIINFNLIALPMSEMVGAASRIGPYRISDIAALVIIFVEISMGLYLMEALRFTRLFPAIGAMDDRMRHRLIWISFSILASLACVESALAFMRDQIATDLSALRASLAQINGSGSTGVSGVNTWIPMVGQMVLGFVLPFALTFVAIPLESLVHSSRNVMGDLGVLFLRSMSAAFRFIGKLFEHLNHLLQNIYDIFIFLPLWLEGLIRNSVANRKQLKPMGKLEIDEPTINLTHHEVGTEQVIK